MINFDEEPPFKHTSPDEAEFEYPTKLYGERPSGYLIIKIYRTAKTQTAFPYVSVFTYRHDFENEKTFRSFKACCADIVKKLKHLKLCMKYKGNIENHPAWPAMAPVVELLQFKRIKYVTGMSDKLTALKPPPCPRPGDPDYAPYGRYEGPRGSPEDWRAAHEEVWTAYSGKEFLGDESPWDILGVNFGSPLSAVKTAFSKLILVHHPDRGGDENMCKKILAAWAILKEIAK